MGRQFPRKHRYSAFPESLASRYGKDGMLVAVFPTPTMQGIVVSPHQLQSDIEEELSCL
jgi:hypothetical protein